MALHFVLRVNQLPIGSFKAERREEFIPPSTLCTYDVQVIVHGRVRNVVVEHRRREGPMALVQKALEAIGPWVRER
jgi:hypothetical protein